MDLDIHFVGDGWHYKREVANIGVIVVFRRLGQVRRREVVVLQSEGTVHERPSARRFDCGPSVNQPV